jgi:hypothetical protein
MKTYTFFWVSQQHVCRHRSYVYAGTEIAKIFHCSILSPSLLGPCAGYLPAGHQEKDIVKRQQVYARWRNVRPSRPQSDCGGGAPGLVAALIGAAVSPR